MTAICVYCGASVGSNPIYQRVASELGKLIAAQDLILIYGGSCFGTMGVLAQAALAAGGKVIGVIAEVILSREQPQIGLSELVVVSSLQDRKDKMVELADAFIALPGGGGTLEEFADIFSRLRLGLHHKPLGLLNVANYYDSFILFLQRMVQDQFLSEAIYTKLSIDNSPNRLLEKLLQQIDSS